MKIFFEKTFKVLIVLFPLLSIFSCSTKFSDLVSRGEEDIVDEDEAEDIFIPKYVKIPAGTFTMGSNKGGPENKPAHKVTVSRDFLMCNHEVTQGEYKSVMNTNPSFFVGDDEDKIIAENEKQDNRPVEQVNWYMALVYCNKLSIMEDLTPCYTFEKETNPDLWGKIPRVVSYDEENQKSILNISDEELEKWNRITCNWNANGYRLPSEAEWEYAARGGDNTIDKYVYSGTYEPEEFYDFGFMWCRENSDFRTHEVGKRTANKYGLYDMGGNVYEWCWNWWEESGNYSEYKKGVIDPHGYVIGKRRVYRGGCFEQVYYYCNVSHRFGEEDEPYYQGKDCGFRVVRTAE